MGNNKPTKETWLKIFDNTYSNFEWFIEKHEPIFNQALKEARKENNCIKMMSIMNEVWFLLPDDEFNIIVNPDGWKNFLYLIEEPFE